MPTNYPLVWTIILSSLIGASIGGMTNFLAIRMLFRPHRPWRLGKLRVPLTPGMIPSRQHELAEKISNTVSEHLIPSDELVKALDTEQFKNAVRKTVQDNLRQHLESTIGDTLSEYGGDWRRATAIFCDHLQNNLISIAESEEVRLALDAMARRQTERLAKHLSDKMPQTIFNPIRQLFEKSFEPYIRQAVAAALHDCVKSPATIATMIEELRPRIEEKIRLARPCDYVPEKTVERIADAITEKIMQFIRKDAEKLIAQLDIRSLAASRIRQFPSEKIEQLTIECARRELSAITWFGFFLGGLIGLLNPLLQQLLN